VLDSLTSAEDFLVRAVPSYLPDRATVGAGRVGVVGLVGEGCCKGAEGSEEEAGRAVHGEEQSGLELLRIQVDGSQRSI
jgi:hypothetical protein